MTKLEDARVLIEGQTVVGVFRSERAAHDAVQLLERAGLTPDRIGVVKGNVRQAREVAGAYSARGALIGAIVGALLVVGLVALGGEALRQNAVGTVAGGLILVLGLAFIGLLAGRARLFKEDEYAELEDDVAEGEILVSVLSDTPDGADVARRVLERAHAADVRMEGTAEAV